MNKRWLQTLLYAGAGLGAAVYSYARFVEPSHFDLTEHDLALPRLAPDFDGYTLVHLSDIHFDEVMTTARLLRVFERVNAVRPDAIVITGDFVTYSKNFDGAALTACLAKLKARDGVFAVFGNHDLPHHTHALQAVLTRANITVLNNGVVTLRRGDAGLHLAGVDSVFRRRARLDHVLPFLANDSHPAILLAHEPDYADVAAATKRFALQLSGHAHAGQIRLPVFTRLGLPEHGTRYIKGLTLVGDMLLYSNRGLGTTSAPLRFNSRPEIAVFRLRSVLVHK